MPSFAFAKPFPLSRPWVPAQEVSRVRKLAMKYQLERMEEQGQGEAEQHCTAQPAALCSDVFGEVWQLLR